MCSSGDYQTGNESCNVWAGQGPKALRAEEGIPMNMKREWIMTHHHLRLYVNPNNWLVCDDTKNNAQGQPSILTMPLATILHLDIKTHCTWGWSCQLHCHTPEPRHQEVPQRPSYHHSRYFPKQYWDCRLAALAPSGGGLESAPWLQELEFCTQFRLLLGPSSRPTVRRL